MSAAGRSDAAGTGHVRHADDFYVTPTWVTREILPHLPCGWRVLDPCCGDGAILDAMPGGASRYGYEIDAGRAATAAHDDIQIVCCDALAVDEWPVVDLIVTNPPFSLAREFVEASIARATPRATVAILLRLGFLASQARAAFHREHPSDVYVLPRRPSFTSDGKTDASEYAWFVWGPGRGGRWSVLDAGRGDS